MYLVISCLPVSVRTWNCYLDTTQLFTVWFRLIIFLFKFFFTISFSVPFSVPKGSSSKFNYLRDVVYVRVLQIVLICITYLGYNDYSL